MVFRVERAGHGDDGGAGRGDAGFGSQAAAADLAGGGRGGRDIIVVDAVVAVDYGASKSQREIQATKKGKNGEGEEGRR